MTDLAMLVGTALIATSVPILAVRTGFWLMRRAVQS